MLDFSSRPDGPSVRLVLAMQVIFSVLLAVLAQMVFTAIAHVGGWETDYLQGAFDAAAMPDQRWQMRLMLALNHLGTFVLAGALTVATVYGSRGLGRQHWPDYLGTRRSPSVLLVGLSVLLLLVSMPVVLWLLEISKALPLPEVFRLLEDDTEEMLKGLLQMDGTGELAANLVLIALLPAIGEELVFRGVVQRQFMRWLGNAWGAIALAAAVFSAIHLQFEGFLSRWLLGMVLGWLYWRTGNFWVPVVAHFFNNAFQVLGQYAYRRQMSTIDLEQDVHIPWQAALFSALLMWAVVRLIMHHTQPPEATPPSLPDYPA